MPSVGMRRTTRVFGVVKRVDGARVLRSGRRLWPDSAHDSIKPRRFLDRDDWYSLMKKNTNNANGHKITGLKSYGSKREQMNQKDDVIITNNHDNNDDEDKRCSKKPKALKVEEDGESIDRMLGVVYSRKRKRLDNKITRHGLDKMYGISYSRRRRRKRNAYDGCYLVLAVRLFEDALCSVLGYMRKKRLGSSQLAEVLPRLITAEHSCHGLSFLTDVPAGMKGFCKFSGVSQFTPLFSVDFAAVPLCFMYTHRTLLLRMLHRSFIFVNKSIFLCSNEEMIRQGEESQPMELSEAYDETLVSEACRSSSKDMLHPSVRASKLAGRNAQYRNGFSSRSFRKRRSSLGRRRAKNLSLGLQKANGAIVSGLASLRKNDISSPALSRSKLKSSLQQNSSARIRGMSATTTESNQDMDSLCCSANLLVIESDRCCREEGFAVTLELSSSREWLLVVRKDGSIRYTFKAQELMKPCSCNRLTHAIMWTGDGNWKLEFCNRQDWSIFKELYKECSNRNESTPIIKVIPVPRINEVLGYGDDNGVPFSRPVSYISVNADEVSRAMSRTTAIYDLDSEDEEWLKKFNSEPLSENEPSEYLSKDNFELIVDGLEKAVFSCPDDYSEEKAVARIGHLASREVVEAVYKYWMRKRKQKKAPLLRVFQSHHVKKTPVIPKASFRKRRSFKRQASQQFGRGKQTSLLQVMAAEQNSMEELNATFRVDEAKVAAKRAEEAAVVMRRRAQVLMENADLATYKAVMALRIAEAARVAQSSEAATSHFLD